MKKIIFYSCLLLISISAGAQVLTNGIIGNSMFSTNQLNNRRVNRTQLLSISPFELHKQRTLIRAKAIEKFDMQNRSAAKVDVAQTIKVSYWSNANNVWDLVYATDATYANDKLVSELYLSYSLSDTLGKKIYNYDVNGRYSIIEYKIYNPINHTYSESDKTTYSYSTNGSYVTLLEFYNTQTNTWTPNYRDTYKFNSHKAQIKFLRESYNNGLWSISQGDSSYITYYNNTSKILQDKSIGYNLNTNMWEAWFETIRSYNNIGQRVRKETYLYINNVASLNMVDSVKYDASGLPISDTYYDGATMEEKWLYDSFTWKGSYNPNVDVFENDITSCLVKVYNNNTWELRQRFTLIYPDSFGSNISLSELYENNQYIPYHKEVNTNDFNFHLIENSTQDYDTTTSNWRVLYGNFSSYQYDANKHTTEVINKILNYGDTTHVNTDRIEYSNYITILAGVSPNKNTLEVKIYPNPSENGNVKINLNLEKSSNISISVIDINGRKVSSQEVNLGTGLNTVQLSNMNTGLYFIEIISDYGISKTKLIVK